MNCKQYQVKSKVIKCSSENHSEHCLKEQELKKQYPSAKEIIWNAEKQNWTINFNYLDKTPTKSKKAQKEEIFEEEKE